MKIMRLRKRQILKFLIILKCILVVYFLFRSIYSSATTIPAVRMVTQGMENEHQVQINEPIHHVMNNKFVSTTKSILDHDITDYNLIKSNGEMGKAFNIDPNVLSVEEKKEFEEGWEAHQFNRYASDRIPINRTLPDARLPRYLIFLTVF